MGIEERNPNQGTVRCGADTGKCKNDSIKHCSSRSSENKIVSVTMDKLRAKEGGRVKDTEDSNAAWPEQNKSSQCKHLYYFICIEKHLQISFGIHWELV